ncbi:hypothetical protein [Micromonospora tulbaghiae]
MDDRICSRPRVAGHPTLRLRGSQFRAKMRVVMSDSDSLGSYTVELTARQCEIIDETLDNEVSVEAENGDPRGDVECRSIRDHVACVKL